MSDTQARIALKYFHNESLKYSGYKITFDALLTKLYKTRVSQGLNALSSGINASELDEASIKRIFEGLAREGKGKIPSSANVFFDALRGEVSGVHWVDVKEIIVNSAVDVGTGVVSAGQTVIDTAKSLQVVLPILIVGAVIFIVVRKTRAVAG